MDKVSNTTNFLKEIKETLVNPIANKIKDIIKEEDIKPIDFNDTRVVFESLNDDGTWEATICLPQRLADLPPYTDWQIKVPLMKLYGKVELLKDNIKYIDLPNNMMLFNVKFKDIPDNDKCNPIRDEYCDEYKAAYVKVPEKVRDPRLEPNNEIRERKIEKYILEKLSKKYNTNIELIEVSWRNDPVYFDDYLAVYHVPHHKD
jgi:hypothetical protein